MQERNGISEERTRAVLGHSEIAPPVPWLTPDAARWLGVPPENPRLIQFHINHNSNWGAVEEAHESKQNANFRFALRLGEPRRARTPRWVRLVALAQSSIRITNRQTAVAVTSSTSTPELRALS